MKQQSKKKSVWSTFRNAYLRPYNLKKFWRKLDKKNLPEELKKVFDLFVESNSYNWSSKFWRRLAINHLKVISQKNFDSSLDVLSREYFTYINLRNDMIDEACQTIENKNIDLKINLFKKQNNFSYEDSLKHNIILYLLYENIKDRDVYKNINKLEQINKRLQYDKPSLNVNGTNVSQDDLNSLFEFEKIKIILKKITNKSGNILEIGAGSGRTTQTMLSLSSEINKYVIADIPPAINHSFKNIKNIFINKKIITAYEAKNTEELTNILNNFDIIFIFPHQLEMINKKMFDISIAIDCLHEMEERIVKKYIENFEKLSHSMYFKVWENAGLPNSFYKSYSALSRKDYFIKNEWEEILKEKCVFPSNYYQLGYKF